MPTPKDEIDLNHLRDTASSAGYNMIAERIVVMLEGARLQCERPSQIQNVAFAQGQVAALRVVLDLPQIIEAEILAARK